MTDLLNTAILSQAVFYDIVVLLHFRAISSVVRAEDS